MANRLVYTAKNWGRTAIVDDHNGVLIYQAFVVEGESSIHIHEHDVNVITSVDATIRILFYDDGPDKTPTSSVVLESGDKVIIQSKRIHQFSVIEPGAIIEVYYADKRDFDIVRFNV
jgi:hypothetical protein